MNDLKCACSWCARWSMAECPQAENCDDFFPQPLQAGYAKGDNLRAEVESMTIPAVYKLKSPAVSYQCLICEKAQDETADIINTGVAWLCPECKRKLRKVVGIE